MNLLFLYADIRTTFETVTSLSPAFRKAGIKGNKPWSIEKIIEVGKKDTDYSSAKRLVSEGKHNNVSRKDIKW